MKDNSTCNITTAIAAKQSHVVDSFTYLVQTLNSYILKWILQLSMH